MSEAKNQPSETGMPTPIVQVEDVSKIYKIGDSFVKALLRVNLEVMPAEFLMLMGPSGSGKSTLLHLIGGLDRPTRGRVTVDGIEFTDQPESVLARLRHDKIGFVFQSYNLIPVLSAIENVELPLLFDPVSQEDVKKRAKALLELVGLGDRINHKPAQLSGGEQQRVAIARALIVTPKLIVADEPTANVDATTAISLLELMAKLNRENQVTFITASHDDRVAKYATRVVKVRDGAITT
jgi:putative ABC transport system ATP-binding protein